MMRRCKGFTLIELLVVIAIIAILAAMLFPVFARARESARKIQCLSNIKNIAMAVQMYLTDYDSFPPYAKDAALAAWLESQNGGWPACETRLNHMNPYVQWPVVLEEYIKNRDVWQCPSARMSMAPIVIVPGYYPGGIAGWWEAWGSRSAVCNGSAFPPGWGGAVTDSVTQGETYNWEAGAGEAGTFNYSVNANPYLTGMKASRMTDPSWTLTVAEVGVGVNRNDVAFTPGLLAYPDVCGTLGTILDGGYFCDIGGNLDCGMLPEHRSDNAWLNRHTRHLGGSNLGFADGHAAWMNARGILAESPRYSQGPSGGGAWVERKILGFPPLSGCTYVYVTAAGDPAAGVPEGWFPADSGTPLY